MIDTDRKLRLEHMSAKEMVDANIAVSKDMFSLIYKNPCIRDLPKIASLYGLYGTFIIGHTDLFFAFGLSHETVHQEKIVEGAGWVFPEKILKKNRVLARRAVLLPRFQCFQAARGQHGHPLYHPEPDCLRDVRV